MDKILFIVFESLRRERRPIQRPRAIIGKTRCGKNCEHWYILEVETERSGGCVLDRLCTQLSKNIHGSKFVNKSTTFYEKIKNIVL